MLALNRPSLAAFTASICAFHLGISIFLCPALRSLLSGHSQEGEGSFQFPVMDGGYNLC